MSRFHQLLLEELRSQQAQEQAQLLKSQRCATKTRLALFKDSLKMQEAHGGKQTERAKQVQGPSGANEVPQSMGSAAQKCQVMAFRGWGVTWAVPYLSLCSRRRGGSSYSSSRLRTWQSWSRCRYKGESLPLGLPTPLLPFLDDLPDLPSPRVRRCISWLSRSSGSWDGWTRSMPWSSVHGGSSWQPAWR